MHVGKGLDIINGTLKRMKMAGVNPHAALSVKNENSGKENEMKKKKWLVFLFVFFGASLSIFGSGQAHEWIVKPQLWDRYQPGQALPFRVVSSHVFMKSEELENPKNVEALFEGRQIPLHPNEVFKSFDGEVVLEKAGAAIIRAHRKGEVWSKTAQGMKKGDRKTLKGVIESRKYEKFCKTLLPVGGNSAGFDLIVGDALEIVPINDPFHVGVGDDLRVRILHRGQPVSPEVTATYDGFSDTPNTYAYFTETGGDGEAKVRISAPGLWMVRVQYAVDEKGENYEKHVMRAVLVFPVRP